MEIGCINYKKPEVFLCYVKMTAQSNDYFEFIGEYSGVLDYVKREFNDRMYYSDRSEIRDRICQKERTDIHIWTKLSI